MKKRLWLNALLLLSVALLLFLPLDKSEQNQNAEHNKSQQQRLFEVPLHNVQRIMIERQGKEDVLLMKKSVGQQQYWLLIKPALAPLNHQRIQHLLTILDEPIQGKLPRKTGDLQAFQLETEQIKLTINDEKLTFGMINPITKNRYVLKNSHIYTIKEVVYGTLGSSVTQLLQHRLLPHHVYVTKLDAPAGFYDTIAAKKAWHSVEATNIADYSDNETILGIVSLTIQNNKQYNESDGKRALTTLVFDILAIKPTLILGRADLKVKYTVDKIAAKRLLALE